MKISTFDAKLFEYCHFLESLGIKLNHNLNLYLFPKEIALLGKTYHYHISSRRNEANNLLITSSTDLIIMPLQRVVYFDDIKDEYLYYTTNVCSCGFMAYTDPVLLSRFPY